MIRVFLFGVALFALTTSCKRSQPTQVEPAPAADVAVSASPSSALPGPLSSAEPPRREVPWELPAGPLAESEKPLVGTWVATVGSDATRSAFMADKIVLAIPDGGKGVSGLVDAVEQDKRIKTSCVWLELFEKRTGIRRECALVNGEPSALDLTNPLTGEKSDAGTAFEWFYDQPSRTVRIRFNTDMLVPSTVGNAPHNLRFRTWQLRFGERAGEGFKMEETIPEHDYRLPVQYVYEIFPGRFLDGR